MNAFPPVPKLLETDLLFNIEKYYTKMKYKYIYIRICQAFLYKGLQGRDGATKGVRLHHETKYNKNKIKKKYEKLNRTKQKNNKKKNNRT